MFSSVGCSGRRSRKTKEKKPQTFQRPSNFKSTVQLNKMGTQLFNVIYLLELASTGEPA
jgi:hypothetical protein